MSDLISRSALIKAMEKKYDVAKEKAFYNVGLSEGFIVCEELIKEQPTVDAISKEKVQEIVKRLEEYQRNYTSGLGDFTDELVDRVLRNVIGIVKGDTDE